MRAGLAGLAIRAGLCVALWCASGVAAATRPEVFSGVVVRVSDGDTVWVRPDPTTDDAAKARRHKPVKLRLVGIDAPERCQAHGEEATRALSALVMDRRVTVRRRATDDYGRALGTLSVEGRDVAASLVRDGHAWSARYRRDPGPYAREEQAARAARLGLFAQRDPQLPKDFRREHGPCASVAPMDRPRAALN